MILYIKQMTQLDEEEQGYQWSFLGVSCGVADYMKSHYLRAARASVFYFYFFLYKHGTIMHSPSIFSIHTVAPFLPYRSRRYRIYFYSLHS